MCGIAGFYGFRDDELIKNISEQLTHRGPDGEGFFISEKATLLNRRLAIIDLKTGDQPIFNEDESIVVTFNGEIYNYQTLRLELEKSGHKFKTNSDTEVIVHGYEVWGEKCFDRFNGMFTVALYDRKKDKLLIARDHFGIKPLYYSTTSKDKFIFASEIKPIIQSGLISTKPNDRIVYRYLKYRIHDDQEETFFKGVLRLMPGELLIIDSNGITKKSFTNLRKELDKQNNSKRKIDKKVIEEFKSILQNAIKLRLISDVPVGTCLSGGLDSSTIVAIVEKLLKQKVKEAQSVGQIQNAFSAVFPGAVNNEEKYIDGLIGSLDQVKNYKVYPKPEVFFAEIDDFIKTQEEPTISTGPYAQYKVMQQAKKQVKVLLDGQGADEMLAGYDPYYFVYLRQLLRNGKYVKFVLEFLSSLHIIWKYVLKTKKNVNPDSLLKEKFIKQYRDEKFEFTKNNLKKRLVEDIFFNSLPSLLRYEDKNSMRFSIEGRVPFLDFNLVRFIFSLPDEAIFSAGWNKNILRNAVSDLVPDNIRKRKNKIGFTNPEHEWFIKMKNRILSVFLSESFVTRPYFKQKEIVSAFKGFIEGKTDDTLPFWRLLNVELWLRIFFDKPEKQIKQKRVTEFETNPKKKLQVFINKKNYFRFPIKTMVFEKNTDFIREIIKYTLNFINRLFVSAKYKDLEKKEWFVVVSEKIIAIGQGRSFFLEEIHPKFWAKFLSKFVKKTPYGIGLGSPWTMQLAIDEVGLSRILFATTLSALTKPFGKEGIFYHIAGREVAAIDGPTEYSLYPSNVSAKLGPKNPKKVAEELAKNIRKSLPIQKRKSFLGAVIIDANDLGQNVLGNSTPIKSSTIEEIFSDNPMGQTDEQTPLTAVICI